MGGNAHATMVDLSRAWSNHMTKPTLVVVAAALLLGGTSLASAKNKGAAGAHSKPSRPSVNEVTPGPQHQGGRAALDGAGPLLPIVRFLLWF